MPSILQTAIVTPRPSRRTLGLWLIGLPFAVAMIAIVPVDYPWTVALTEVRIPGFVTLMRRTLFEGGGIGGSDLSILLFIGIVLLYFIAQRAEPGSRLTAWRPVLGYWFVSALAAGLGAVHTLKWVMGRPRPYSVLGREHLPYSEWYQVGSHYVTEGIYRGSFPSGHTAAVFILMTLVYAYGGNSATPLTRRATAWVLGALVLAYTASMGIASAMARSHWLSDAIAATGMVWVLIHALYFLLLRVPEQQGYWTRHQRSVPMPTYWELRFCGWGFIALLGVLAVGLGVRAFWEQSPPYLAALIPLGALLWWAGYPRARGVIRLLHEHLDGAGVSP